MDLRPRSQPQLLLLADGGLLRSLMHEAPCCPQVLMVLNPYLLWMKASANDLPHILLHSMSASY